MTGWAQDVKGAKVNHKIFGLSSWILEGLHSHLLRLTYLQEDLVLAEDEELSFGHTKF